MKKFKNQCECCDKTWHDKYNDRLTLGEHFFLVLMMSGGFNMLYVKDVISRKSDCLRKQVKRFVEEKILKVEYAGLPQYGYGLYSFTKKGVNFYNKFCK